MEDSSRHPVQTAQSHFPLLQLPRETRDIIYQYALSEPEGLFFRMERTTYEKEHGLFTAFSTREAANDGDAQEANQLKYVCHQIRAETAGLGVKVNDLTFTVSGRCDHSATWYSRSIKKCDDCNFFGVLEGFLENCSPKRLAQIRNISMAMQKGGDDHLSEDDAALFNGLDRGIITSFLSAYPRATFNWYIDDYFNEFNLFYHYAHFLQNALQNHRVRYHPRFKAAADVKDLKNFNIWPPRSLRFDESAVRQAFDRQNNNSLFAVKWAFKSAEEAIAEFKRWTEHGTLA